MGRNLLRTIAGAILHDATRFEWNLHSHWPLIRNRNEQITIDGLGRVRCDWRWTSSIHYCDVFPGAGARLMRRATRDWPVRLEDDPPACQRPEISFLIGHRGGTRLPLLLQTIRSIAGQEGVAVECIVVEQSVQPTACTELPSWVGYLHTPIRRDDEPYNRSATFNAAVRRSKGRILVLHDNDMLVPAAYAREIVQAMNSGFDAVDLKRFIFYLGEDGHRCERVIQNLRGGSVAIRREAYEAIGGFDESFVGWGGEDNEFWDRAETLRASTFGYLPIFHLWHAPQPEKAQAQPPGVKRYHDVLSKLTPEERIARLRAMKPPG